MKQILIAIYYLNDSKTFIEFSNDVHDIYKNI